MEIRDLEMSVDAIRADEPDWIPRSEDEIDGLRLRLQVLAKYPALANGDIPVPSEKFWDFYNDGGKDALIEAGIFVRKSEAGDWSLSLGVMPYDARVSAIEEFLDVFSITCPQCGSGIVLERKVCKNGMFQYRQRCENWFEPKHSPQSCRAFSGSDSLKHVIVDYLDSEFGLRVVER